MFYEKTEEILDSKESNGWGLTARRMNLTVDQLRRKIHKKSLTLEEGLSLVRASESPALLAWVLGQVRPVTMNAVKKSISEAQRSTEVMKGIQRGSTMSVASSRGRPN